MLHRKSGSSRNTKSTQSTTSPKFLLLEIQHRLEEIIGVSKVDLIQKGAIHPALREQILSEAVNVA